MNPYLVKLQRTRMHSSRMHTARSSSRPGGFSTRHPLEQTPPQSRPPPGADPPHEQNDRHVQKYYLAPKLYLRAVMIVNSWFLHPKVTLGIECFATWVPEVLNWSNLAFAYNFSFYFNEIIQLELDSNVTSECH